MSYLSIFMWIRKNTVHIDRNVKRSTWQTTSVLYNLTTVNDNCVLNDFVKRQCQYQYFTTLKKNDKNRSPIFNINIKYTNFYSDILFLFIWDMYEGCNCQLFSTLISLFSPLVYKLSKIRIAHHKFLRCRLNIAWSVPPTVEKSTEFEIFLFKHYHNYCRLSLCQLTHQLTN